MDPSRRALATNGEHRAEIARAISDAARGRDRLTVTCDGFGLLGGAGGAARDLLTDHALCRGGILPRPAARGAFGDQTRARGNDRQI